MSKSCVYLDKESKKIYYKIFDPDNLYKNNDYIKIPNKEGKWKEFNINDFNVGFFCGGKLSYKHVPGGVVLVETSFLLKEKL